MKAPGEQQGEPGRGDPAPGRFHNAPHRKAARFVHACRSLALLASLLFLGGCTGRRTGGADAASSPPPAHSAGSLAQEILADGPLESRFGRPGADLVIFYGGEHRGSLEPCGCAGEQRGGVPRLSTWVKKSERRLAKTPWILLHTGYTFDDAIVAGGTLRGDARVRNRWMARILGTLPWSAINLGHRDLAGLAALPPGLPALPLVSANVRSTGDAPAPARWRVVERGSLTIGITGITRPAPSLVSGIPYDTTPPVPAAEGVLEEHANTVDLVILLAWNAIDAARRLAERRPEIDLVIEADHHNASIPPFRVGRAVWIKSAWETRRLGELHLWIEDGEIRRALDRRVDLDPEIPDDPEMLPLLQQARREIRARETELFGF